MRAAPDTISRRPAWRVAIIAIDGTCDVCGLMIASGVEAFTDHRHWRPEHNELARVAHVECCRGIG